MSGSYIEESKRPWHSGDEKPDTDQLILGCLQRIALATESMAKNYNSLLVENESLKRTIGYKNDDIRRAKSRMRGLKAAITRMKNNRGKL